MYRVGQKVYILINPFGFQAKSIFGQVQHIDPGGAHGGDDIVYVRYQDPATKEFDCRGFRTRYLAPNDSELLRCLANDHRQIAEQLEALADALGLS